MREVNHFNVCLVLLFFLKGLTMNRIFNIRAVLVASLIGLMAPAIAGPDHDLTPKHGGVVVETKVGDIEIVAKPTSIQIFIADHGKAVKLDGAKAKVTLLNGTEKSEVDLVAVGGKLEVKGAFVIAKGTKGIAIVTLAGKPATTARFAIK